jgi:16S rRNA (cytosine967-C5)-methyltransferase
MNSRRIAVKIVQQVLCNDAYSNIVINNEFKNRELSEKDKGLITEIVYGTIRYKYTIDYIIQSLLTGKLKDLQDEVLCILRISIYQMKYLDRIPVYAIVNDAVNICKKLAPKGSKLVNAVLRNYWRNKDKNFLKEKDPISVLCYDYSFDRWMVNLLIDQYGIQRIEDILKNLNCIPSITVRVNSLKITYDEAKERLKELGYSVEEGSVCPDSISILKGGSIEQNELFKEGIITVQDESAMLVAPTLCPSNEDVVYDLCSAPGGKTTHIGELLNNKGKIIAFDVHKNKLSLIISNAKRLNINNIECRVMDSSVFNESLVNSCDKILLDVPCSGIGIIKKKPEIKWSKTREDLYSITNIQKKILNNGAKYLKPGGILVYSTCTINKDENENLIDEFLTENNNFVLEKTFFGNKENLIYYKEGMTTILPSIDMDGFFIAKLKKIK